MRFVRSTVMPDVSESRIPCALAIACLGTTKWGVGWSAMREMDSVSKPGLPEGRRQ